MRKASITADEVRVAREQMGLTREQLAEEMGIDADDLRKWEDGSVAPPRGTGQNLAYTAALLEQRAALAASGLPECAWVTAWDQEPEAEDLDGMTADLERLNEHSAACPACLARERYLDQRFPPLPELYTPPLMRAVDVVMTSIGRLPSWLRPAAAGALIMFFLVGFRVLFPGYGGWGDRSIALLGAMGAGACGGLAFSAVHPAFRNLGRPGMVLTSTACALTCVSLIALQGGFLGFGDGFVDDGQVKWTWVVVISLAIGLVLGYQWSFPDRGITGRRRS